jgi:hypothetical protein
MCTYPGDVAPSVVIIGLSASFFRFLVAPEDPFDAVAAAAAAGVADAPCCAAESVGCCEPFMLICDLLREGISDKIQKSN